VHLKLRLTEDIPLRAHGFVADGALFAEVCWEHPIPDSSHSQGTLRGTPAAMRRLAALAVQAAIQAEEEACWQARQATTTTTPKRGRVA
jgi:hypothetical protein